MEEIRKAPLEYCTGFDDSVVGQFWHSSCEQSLGGVGVRGGPPLPDEELPELPLEPLLPEDPLPLEWLDSDEPLSEEGEGVLECDELGEWELEGDGLEEWLERDSLELGLALLCEERLSDDGLAEDWLNEDDGVGEWLLSEDRLSEERLSDDSLDGGMGVVDDDDDDEDE